MDKRKQLRTWIRALDHFEIVPDGNTPGFRSQLAYARNAFVSKSATGYELTGHPANHLLAAHRENLTNILAVHYRRVIPYFAQTAVRQIRRVEKKYTQPLYDGLVSEWINREALRKATMIADTDRDDVLNAIDNGITDGLGTEEIARNIRQVSQLTPFRAATVARTETHAAATFGSVESVRAAERDLGVTMLKEWLPTLDDRTRPEHAAMANAEAIPMDEKFVVGGEMMDRPGDPSASVGMNVNCRCTLIYSEAESSA